MDITPTTTILPPKSPEPEPETSTRIQPIIKPLSFSNGVLKRHHQHQHAILHHVAPVAPVAVTYKECLKNHAAAMGVHSVDGCGEFMPSPAATATDPTSLKCAACGCHRNFHRREPDLEPLPAPSPAAIEYQPHHRHHPPPPPPPQFHRGSPTSSSPPPISSSYAPHMLLALSTGSEPSPGRKRFRTKFSPVQKEQMFRFAERLGWKMQKRDDELIQAFCNEAKIDKGVLKVWMHNNKNTFVKRVVHDAVAGADNDGAAQNSGDKITHKSNGNSSKINNLNNNHHHEEDEEDDENGIDRRQLQFGISVAGGAVNGGSSSSS